MEYLSPLLGQHALSIWTAGIIWSLIGIAIVKTYYYDKDVSFDLKFYINDNIKDILLGILSSLIIMRLGDYAIDLLQNKFGLEIPDTKDIVVFMIIISASIQVKLHKDRKPVSKKLKAEMWKENEDKKHQTES